VAITAAEADLRLIKIDLIDRNPENPRIHFRQKEMEDLIESIAIHGIQVPISVYRDGRRYTIIDGERRWRSALKLNLAAIPALVQQKPDKLTNLLLMFNIHALREQWDLLTIAMKLSTIIGLLEHEKGARPTEIEISRATGLTRGVIRRCRYLLALPTEFQRQLDAELKKPKREQKLTEDFFIEMERALTTVERAMPDVLPDRSRVRRVLIAKFRSGVIDNRVHFRHIARIARAAKVDVNVVSAKNALEQLFSRNDYSIERAYEDTVAGAYGEKEIAARLDGIIARLSQLRPRDIDGDLRSRLQVLSQLIHRLVRQ